MEYDGTLMVEIWYEMKVRTTKNFPQKWVIQASKLESLRALECFLLNV